MKKNKFMKLASGLLVLCLMTTCVIGATLAKYTTANTTTDQARVARWGVKVSADTPETFKTSYTKTESGAGIPELTVVSSPTEKVVAPGTSGTAAAFSITGTPEVAVRITFAMTVTSDVMLGQGDYTDINGNPVHVDTNYYPVKFTLNDGTSDVVDGGTLTDVKAYLEGHPIIVEANVSLATVAYTLSWEWAFDEGAGGNDVADTLLGDIEADKVSKGSNTVSTDINYSLTITVTQID